MVRKHVFLPGCGLLEVDLGRAAFSVSRAGQAASLAEPAMHAYSSWCEDRLFGKKENKNAGSICRACRLGCCKGQSAS